MKNIINEKNINSRLGYVPAFAGESKTEINKYKKSIPKMYRILSFYINNISKLYGGSTIHRDLTNDIFSYIKKQYKINNTDFQLIKYYVESNRVEIEILINNGEAAQRVIMPYLMDIWEERHQSHIKYKKYMARNSMKALKALAAKNGFVIKKKNK